MSILYSVQRMSNNKSYSEVIFNPHGQLTGLANSPIWLMVVKVFMSSVLSCDICAHQSLGHTPPWPVDSSLALVTSTQFSTHGHGAHRILLLHCTQGNNTK